MPTYLHVALPVPLRETFSYYYDGSQGEAKIGARVKVPFTGRELVGVITAINDKPNCAADKIKDIERLIDTDPIMPEELMNLCLWAASYYHHPVGEVVYSALPQRYRDGEMPPQKEIYVHTAEGKGLPDTALKRAKKQQALHQHLLKYGQIQLEELKSLDIPQSAVKGLAERGLIHKIIEPETASDEPGTIENLFNEPPLQLNSEQAAAFQAIQYHRFETYLLQGATGSGKTELYLHAIASTLNRGKQALVLIPEIGLGPQTIRRFQQRFRVKIAELHSHVAEAARARAWYEAKTGQARIVIGTRLASLTPFNNLGIIIIDEEHDRSFKQQDGFKYSARDISIYRAHQLNIPVILGSATPSLETYNNAKRARYRSLVLERRAGSARPPSLESVDLRLQTLTAGLSNSAIEALHTTVERGEQALIFVNRRGYAPALLCQHCGWSADCKYCDARMTVHTLHAHLRCHHCDRSSRLPKSCPQCASNQLATSGFGTEQIEQALTQIFAQTPVIRIDRDSTKTKNSFEEKLANAHSNEACIFVGTQMLAKGHHLPNLTLVIIADADQGLLSPDYRSLESMGQLITQVTGRAGREDKPGHVMIQTYRPEHPLLQTLIKHGYIAFAEAVLEQRLHARLPPFTYTAVFRAESKHSKICLEFLKVVRQTLDKLDGSRHLILVGPHPAAMEKINERYRFSLQIFCASRQYLQNVLGRGIEEIDQHALSKRTRWSLDVDSVAPA